jgi:hypothetical protein
MRRNRRIAPPQPEPNVCVKAIRLSGPGDLRCSTLKKTLLEVAA